MASLKQDIFDIDAFLLPQALSDAIPAVPAPQWPATSAKEIVRPYPHPPPTPFSATGRGDTSPIDYPIGASASPSHIRPAPSHSAAILSALPLGPPLPPAALTQSLSPTVPSHRRGRVLKPAVGRRRREKQESAEIAEERRRKNRESSARCYYKRKKRLLQKEAELECLRHRKLVLYARELSLRRENARLKKEVVMAGIAIPLSMYSRRRPARFGEVGLTGRR